MNDADHEVDERIRSALATLIDHAPTPPDLAAHHEVVPAPRRRVVRTAIPAAIVLVVAAGAFVVGRTTGGTPSPDAPTAASPFVVQTDGMAPAFSRGDRVQVDAVSGPLNRGDVVVVDHAPPAPVIKRVVAVGGETIEAHDGRVWLDGQPLDEPYLAPSTVTAAFGPTLVPNGYLYVMGDNRTDSQDSRFWGPLPRSDIIGTIEADIPPPTPLIPGGLTGRQYNDVANQLSHDPYAFVVQRVDQPTPAVEPGTVLQTRPAEGTPLVPGSPITVVVATPPDTLTVPDLTGKNGLIASAELQRAGFPSLGITQQREASDTIARGLVTRTEPAANAIVPSDHATITIWFSTGPEQVPVPNVLGQTFADASATLQGADGAFTIGVVTNTTSCTTDDDGKIVSQDPSPNTTSAPDAPINLAVCRRTPPGP